MNIGEVTRNTARGEPDRVAVVVDGESCSYGELEIIAARAARVLAAQGIGAGDRVAVVAPSSILLVAAVLGAARIGAAAALINVYLTAREIAQLLDNAECYDAVIAGQSCATTVDEALALRGRGQALGAEALIDDAADGPEPPSQPGEGEALVLFTSGTTGLPKAVGIGHDVVAQRLAYFAEPFAPGKAQNVDLVSVPLFHIGGSLGLFVTLYAGARAVLLPRFDAATWLRLVESQGVNQTFLVPTMMERVLAHPDFDSTDLNSLRTIHYGAAAAPVELVEEALDRFPTHTDFLNTFGQTETLGAYAALTPEDHRARKHLGSAGQPFPGVEVKIVKPSTDEAVEPGEVGEILVRAGQNVAQGWMRTGDLGSQNAEGYLFPSGRLSDTINRGGEKFGPVEIESVIREIKGVRDVAVAVAGVPDREMGERVGAVIVADGTLDTEAVMAHCRERLAHYKLPEYTVFAGEIPRTALGKVSRKQIAERILAEGG